MDNLENLKLRFFGKIDDKDLKVFYNDKGILIHKGEEKMFFEHSSLLFFIEDFVNYLRFNKTKNG